MRPRLRPRCKIAPISVALDETPTLVESLPPDHFLQTGSFAGNLDLCTYHWIHCDTDFKCVQRNLSPFLLLSWAACPNISLDYSWPVDGTATSNILAFVNSLRLIFLSFDKQPWRWTYKVSQKSTYRMLLEPRCKGSITRSQHPLLLYFGTAYNRLKSIKCSIDISTYASKNDKVRDWLIDKAMQWYWSDSTPMSRCCHLMRLLIELGK